MGADILVANRLRMPASSLRIDSMQAASVIRRHFLEELVLTHCRTGGCKVHFGL